MDLCSVFPGYFIITCAQIVLTAASNIVYPDGYHSIPRRKSILFKTSYFFQSVITFFTVRTANNASCAARVLLAILLLVVNNVGIMSSGPRYPGPLYSNVVLLWIHHMAPSIILVTKCDGQGCRNIDIIHIAMAYVAHNLMAVTLVYTFGNGKEQGGKKMEYTPEAAFWVGITWLAQAATYYVIYCVLLMEMFKTSLAPITVLFMLSRWLNGGLVIFEAPCALLGYLSGRGYISMDPNFSTFTLDLIESWSI